MKIENKIVKSKIKKNKDKKVVVAMSGGVDSSVAAALLKAQGYSVIGVMLKLWSESGSSYSKQSEKSCLPAGAEMDEILHMPIQRIQNDIKKNTCCDTEGLLGARAVARKLDIPFYVIDMSREFKQEVVNYYISEYEQGRTPNPCVMCNKFVKFGRLLEIAKSLGADKLATGHYARIKSKILNLKTKNHNSKLKTSQRNKKIYQLLKGKDKEKDQSYFLWQLKQKHLKDILFPVGNYNKEEVRKMARDFGLPVAEKKESQAVCFIPDRDNVGFLKRWAKKLQTSGRILDLTGNKLGEHEGLCYYTIGQRTRLATSKWQPATGIKSKPPLYIIKLDIDNNSLIVGEEKDLYSKELLAENVNWISPITSYRLPVTDYVKCKAKIRYGHPEENAKCKMQNAKLLKVIFNQPQRAITPGQSIVFYDGDEVIGGGIIRNSQFSIHNLQ